METEIFDYGMNGEGVAKIDGKIVLLPGSLIGEKVEIEIEQDNKNFCVAKVKNVLKTSPNRVEPICPYFKECGGCDLQHLSYAEQLKFKKLLVEKTIKKITGLNIDCEQTVLSDKVFNYRNKLSLNCADGKVGFFKEGTNSLIEINHCCLAQENINKILKIFKKYAKKYEKNIKNLVIRDIDNQILVGIVAKEEIDLTDFCKDLSENFHSIGVYLIINKRKDSVVLSGKVKNICGIKEINVENFGLNYSVDLIGFHQTNLDVQNKIYSQVLDFIKPNEVVLNGFSGQGLLSAIIATKASMVYGIEINPSSHKSAENLKRINKIANLVNIQGDFYKKFDKIKQKINTIVLDPAKKGCGKDTLCAIIGVENIVYISCNPIALAKDLRVLLDKYEIEKIVPFDMFPNTKSVETLVKLKIKR